MSFEDSTDEEIRESGVGILEFSPAKAGQDITPANYNFPPKERKRSSSGFTSLPGNSCFIRLISKTLNNKILISKKENTKHSVREVTNFAKGDN